MTIVKNAERRRSSPTILQLQDEDAVREGIQVKAGTLFGNRATVEIYNGADAGAGKVTFASALAGEQAGVSGTEPASIAELTFIPIGAQTGPTSLSLAAGQVKLAGYPTANPAEWQLPLQIANSPLSVTVRAGQMDKEAPAWPQNAALEVSDIGKTSAVLHWPAAADDTGVASYRLYRDGAELATVQGNVYSYTASGLSPGRTYKFEVEAEDASGKRTNGKLAASASTLPDNIADTEPSSWPAGGRLDAENVTHQSVVLRWSPASDNTAVTQYKIYQEEMASVVRSVYGGGARLSVADAVYKKEAATVQGSVYSVSISGLKSNTLYRFVVEAGDASGNWSMGGPSAQATTLSVPADPDTKAPVWPENAKLEAVFVGSDSIALKWPAATDNKEVTAYRIYKGAELLKTLTGPVYSYTAEGLSPGTSYTFEVQAGDMFAKDRTLAMWSHFSNAAINFPEDLNWDYASLPYFKELGEVGPQAFPGYIYISKTSKHKDEVMDVIIALTSYEFQTIRSKMGIETALKNPEIKKTFAQDLAKYKGKNIKAIFPQKYASPAPLTEYNDLAWKRLNTAFGDIGRGTKDIVTAIREANEGLAKDIEAEKTTKK